MLTVVLLAIIFVETVLLAFIAAFLKYFIFGEAHITKQERRVLRTSPPCTASKILEKTYKTSQPESLDWFNVLVAQAFTQFREDAQSKDAILLSLDDVMNGSRKPDFIGHIKITEINMGEEFPIFSNCTIDLVDHKLHATMDVDLSDSITLAIETSLILNYPKPGFMVLPIALGVTLARFSGTLSVAFIKSGTSTMNFALRPDFSLELSVRSLIGSRSRLQDVPKIQQLIESRLRQWLNERVVEPRFQKVAVPNLWPSRERIDTDVDNNDDDNDDDDNERIRQRSIYKSDDT